MSDQENEGESPPQPPQIILDKDQMAGVWANFAQVSQSPFEFTLDFVRLDYLTNPPNGLVVSRVSVSPLFITQLIDVLQAQWEQYASRAMPKEAQDGQQDS